MALGALFGSAGKGQAAVLSRRPMQVWSILDGGFST
jgi:hypothetical protein